MLDADRGSKTNRRSANAVCQVRRGGDHPDQAQRGVPAVQTEDVDR